MAMHAPSPLGGSEGYGYRGLCKRRRAYRSCHQRGLLWLTSDAGMGREPYDRFLDESSSHQRVSAMLSCW
jgi:hypothetical protein